LLYPSHPIFTFQYPLSFSMGETPSPSCSPFFWAEVRLVFRCSRYAARASASSTVGSASKFSRILLVTTSAMAYTPTPQISLVLAPIRCKYSAYSFMPLNWNFAILHLPDPLVMDKFGFLLVLDTVPIPRRRRCI